MWAKPSFWGQRVRRVRPSRRAAVLALAALVVLAAGGAAVTTGLAAEPGSPDMRGLARSTPVRIVIPKLGVDAPVVVLALDRGGLPAPPGPAVAGWYGRGTSPGEPGSAVIVGRARAGPAGPAIFARLDRLAPGDPIRVWRADGTIARFTVERVEQVELVERVEKVERAGEVGQASGPPQDRSGYRGGGADGSLRLVPAGDGADRRPAPVVFARFVP